MRPASRPRRRGGRTRRRRRAPARPAHAERGRSRRTVSISRPAVAARQLGDVGRHGQDLAVLLDGQLGAAPPRPPLEHPLPPGGADAGSQLRRRRGRGRSSPRARRRRPRHDRTVSPSRPVTSGRAPPSVATSAGPGRHRLDRRQAEALVQARHDRQLGLGVQLDDPLVVRRRTRTRRGRAGRAVDEVHALARLRLADDRERDVALGAQLGHRLEQVGEALEGDVGRRRRDQAARDARDVRAAAGTGRGPRRPGRGRMRS